MLIWVSFLSSQGAILLLPKKMAPTLTQRDKVCEEAKLCEDFQQPLSFFSPNTGIKNQDGTSEIIKRIPWKTGS